MITKHQYKDEDIKVLIGSREAFRESVIDKHNNISEGNENSKADEVEGLLNLVISKAPLRQMARLYGRDFIKNYNYYRNYALQMVVEETGELPEHLINDSLNELINRKCKDTAQSTSHYVSGVIVDIFRDVMLEAFDENETKDIFDKALKEMQGKGV